MICYHNKLVWFSDGSKVAKGFYFKKTEGCIKTFLPCGKCKACRINKANEWACRCVHELKYAQDGCFLTLTYNDEHLPSKNGVQTLCKDDLQKFLKRLRRHIEYHCKGKIRSYLACGEYGKRTLRPHYHLLIFGWCPADLKFLKHTSCGSEIFRSETVEDCWPFGFVSVGQLTMRSAAYVARYTKKMVGINQLAQSVPPFQLSSRNIPLSNGAQGAIGAQWCLDNMAFGFNLPYISVDDFKVPVPDYYLKLIERYLPDKYAMLVKAKLDYVNSAELDFVLAHDGTIERQLYTTDGELYQDYWLRQAYLEKEELQKKTISLLRRF